MEILMSNVEMGRKSYQDALQIDDKILLIPPGENDNQVRLYYQQKLQLLLESAKLYLQAVEDVKEESLKFALIYLANQSSDEAAKVKTILLYSQQQPGKPLPQLPHLTNQQDDKQLEKEFTLYSQRLMLQAHINHLDKQELDKINNTPTQAIPPTPQEMVKDLIQLEEKMHGFGLRRISSDAYMRESLMQQSIHLSSQLGESFMVLDTKNNSNLNENKTKAIADQANRTLTHRGRGKDLNLSTIALPQLDKLPPNPPPPPLTSNNPKNNLSSSNTTGLNMSKPTSVQPSLTPFPRNSSSNGSSNVYANVSSNAGNGIINAILKTENEMEKEVQLESVERLLQAIATLRDENYRLEEENQRVRSDMITFKQEYEKKFEAVKPLLETYHRQGETKPNKPVEMPTANPPVSTPIPVTVSTSEPKTINSSTSAESEKLIAQIQKLESRQEALQNVIEGLMAKYYQAKTILQKKEAKINAYEEIVVHKLGKEFLQKDDPPKLSTSSTSDATKKKQEPSSQAAPSSHDVNKTNPSQVNRRTIPSNQVPPTSIPSSSSHPAIYRHPSVSTLQCLQAHTAKTQK